MENGTGMMIDFPTSMSRSSEIAKMDVDRFNAEQGDLTGYDCPICKNKGMVAVFQDGEDKYKPCECMKIRKIEKSKSKSGMGKLLEIYTFERYIADEQWQRKTVEIARRYVEEKSGWFFISGRPGSGKTHICTAIVNGLIKDGIPCKYMVWREEAPRIKAAVNSDEYDDLIKPLKETECLYIDDFLKGNITQGDLNLAYEIINYRYNADCMTIISGEKSIREILEIEEAIGSRIYERTGRGKNVIELKNVSNYRLRG